MITFANFVQKIGFVQSNFQNMSVALAKVYLLVLPSLQVLGYSCFKTPFATGIMRKFIA